MRWAIGAIGQAPRVWLGGDVSDAILAGACGPGEIHVQADAEQVGTIEWQTVDGELRPAFVPGGAAIGADEMLWRQVKVKRNGLLDHWRWTVQPDSPLADDCRAAWLAYLAALNRVTVDFADPRAIAWPDTPNITYA